MIASVSGPSKSGKTVLCESVVGKRGRTNEAKHLPGGTARAELALELRTAESIRRLYEVEWAISFIAFERIVDFLVSFLRHEGLSRTTPA